MLSLFIVASPLAEAELGKNIREKIEKITKNNSIDTIKFVNDPENGEAIAADISEEIAGAIIVVATGGSEETIFRITTTLNKPILLWANPHKNSLAASIEAFAVLKPDYPIRILYAELDSEEAAAGISIFSNICQASHKLDNSKLACVGGPSEWLLTSKSISSYHNFNTEIISLDVADVIEKVEKIDEADAQNVVNELKEQFGKIVVSDADLLESAKVYLAMKELIEEYDLSAITIRCFDLLEQEYTACIGMSLCSDHGIVSGCESDLQATFSMMLATYLTDEPCWMANPSRIDREKNSVILAHCTIPSKMLVNLSESCLVPHMESGLSAAIQGQMKSEKVTLLRIGGNFDKMTIATGNIIRSNINDGKLCRTQAEVKLDEDVMNWLENCLGNHQILVYGDIKKELIEFCKFRNIEIIEGKQS